MKRLRDEENSIDDLVYMLWQAEIGKEILSFWRSLIEE